MILEKNKKTTGVTPKRQICYRKLSEGDYVTKPPIFISIFKIIPLIFKYCVLEWLCLQVLIYHIDIPINMHILHICINIYVIVIFYFLFLLYLFRI